MSAHDVNEAANLATLRGEDDTSLETGNEERPTQAEEVAVAPRRELRDITADIWAVRRHIQREALAGAIEVGRLLVEAKARVPYGEWGTYIKEELDYSQSTVNNLMKIFEEYGKPQQSLFGASANSQSLGNLSYTKALALLALPADEREEFVKSRNVEDMSARELQQAIQERDVAKARLEGAQKELQAAQDESWKLTKELDKAEKKEATLKEQVKQAKEAAEKAAQDLAEAKDALEAMKAQPIDVAVEKPDPAEVDRLAEEKLVKVKKDHKKKVEALEKRLAEAEAAAQEAERALKSVQAGAADAEAKVEATAQAEVEQLKKRLAVAAPEIARFAVHFEAVQREFSAMADAVDALRAAGNEKAAGLKEAVKVFLNQALARVEAAK